MVTLKTILSKSPISIDTAQLEPSSSGARLVATGGRELPLVHSALRAEAAAGIARVVLEQTFVNRHQEPLHVRYQLPLPADGAVSGFSFRIGELRITGEIDRRQRARERFEQALASGRSAAILEQTRTSIFEQEVGNIPPGATVVVEVSIDQPLLWLSEGAWEWRFPTVVGPRYLGAAGRVADASAVMVAVADQPLSNRFSFSVTVRDTLTGSVESPSHPLRVTAEDDGTTARRIELDAGGARLDRDLVVRWPVAAPVVGLALAAARPSRTEHQGHAFGLLTLVPPSPSAAAVSVPRDLIVLIDTSGSMDGRPLDQAQRMVLALIDSLVDRDRLELIEFSSSPRRWQKEPVVATRDSKREASKWIRALRAGGSTEMRDAVLEAITPLRPGAQRQIVLITDGYIGFEAEIIREIVERMPRGCRLHTVGVGSSVNRSLTQAAARAGAGVELIVGLEEDAERLVRRLLDRTAEPLVTELVIEGEGVLEAAAHQLPDLYRATPARVALRLSPRGGEIRVRGIFAGGVFEQRVVAPALALGEGNQAITALFGRERVEDLEARRAYLSPPEVDPAVEKLGIDFQIATRLTSWIAVSETVMVDVSAKRREVRMPHELPEGVSIEGLGLRRAAPGAALATTAAGVLKGSVSEVEALLDQAAAEDFDAFADEGAAGEEPVMRMMMDFDEAPSEESEVTGSGLVLGGPAGPPAAPAAPPASYGAPSPKLKKEAAAPIASPQGALDREDTSRSAASVPEAQVTRTVAKPVPARRAARRWWVWLLLALALLGALVWWLLGRGA